MANESERQVPAGAAIFPRIPDELGVDPLLLAVWQATVFLAGSDEPIVNPEAADEVVESMAAYLCRLKGPRLQGVREDMEVLVSYARQQHWPKQMVRALQSFLADCGLGEKSKP